MKKSVLVLLLQEAFFICMYIYVDKVHTRKYSKIVGIKNEGETMKISTKGRYALRLMIDIAMNDNGEPVRVRTIATRQEISDKYLEQIISILNKEVVIICIFLES